MIWRRTSKNVFSAAISSLSNKGRVVPGAEVQMTIDGSGVYRNIKTANEVRSRWYGVGRGDAGKMVENSSVSRISAGVRAEGSDRSCDDSTSLEGATYQFIAM